MLTRRGQQCDPDGAQKFYGCSGEGLVCQRKTPKGVNRAEPEPSCVCQEKGPVFGSEGWTYPNVFQMRKAVAQTLKLNGRGPSTLVAVPLFYISYQSRKDDTFKISMHMYCCLDRGLSIEPWGTTFLLPQLPVSFKALALFLSLPVSAKTGGDNFLAGDDPHISVQVCH